MLHTRPKGQQPHGAHWCDARTQGRQEKGGQLPKHSVEAEPVALGLGFPPPVKQTRVFHSAAPKWSAVGTAARCLCSGRLPQRRGCPVKWFPIPLVGGHSLSFSSPSFSLLSPRELTRGIANDLCMALLRAGTRDVCTKDVCFPSAFWYGQGQSSQIVLHQQKKCLPVAGDALQMLLPLFCLLGQVDCLSHPFWVPI